MAGQNWLINGSNSGTIGGPGFSFSSFENLTGGTLSDSFSFVGAGALSGQLTDLNAETIVSGAVVAAQIQLANTLLTSNTVLNTSASNGLIQVGAVNGGGFSLGLVSGTGTKTVSGAVTFLSSLLGPALSLQGSGLSSFSDAISSTAGGLDGTGAGNVNFGGNVSLGDGAVGSGFAGLVSFTSPTGTTFSGFDGLSFLGGLSLAGNSSIQSNGSALSLSAVNGNGFGLELTAAGNSLTLSGAATGLSTLTVLANNISVTSVSTTGNQVYTGALSGSGVLSGQVLTLAGAGNVNNGVAGRLQTNMDSLVLSKSSGAVLIREVNALGLSGGNIGVDAGSLDLLLDAGDLTQSADLDLGTDVTLRTDGGSIRQIGGSLRAVNVTLFSSSTLGTLLQPFDTSSTGLLSLSTTGWRRRGTSRWWKTTRFRPQQAGCWFQQMPANRRSV
ncbi:MAG: hypothetical protein HC904_12475 [Blastochloris sp.]|nr:hypothetical protein [Blastochloris sp.]